MFSTQFNSYSLYIVHSIVVIVYLVHNLVVIVVIVVKVHNLVVIVDETCSSGSKYSYAG